jgi:hypothetical protein
MSQGRSVKPDLQAVLHAAWEIQEAIDNRDKMDGFSNCLWQLDWVDELKRLTKVEAASAITEGRLGSQAA